MKILQKNSNQTGFSIAELLVVMVVMLIVMAAVFALMRGAITTANTNYEMTSASQGLRNSQEFITRDILSLGDGIKGLGQIWVPTKFVTDYFTVRSAAVIDPANRGYISIGGVLSDNNVPAATNVVGANPATKVLERTDRITFLAEDKSFTQIPLTPAQVSSNNGTIDIPAARIGDFRAGEIYFLSNGVSATFGTVTNINTGTNKITWGNNDQYGLNRTGNTGSMYSVRGAGLGMNLMRVNIVHYFVDEKGRLTRRAFGIKGTGFTDSVIAEHVLNLQFRYILKPTETGIIFQQPAEQIDISQAASVHMIQPSVVVETAYPLQDGQKQQITGSTQIGVRNIQFLEAHVPRDSQGNTDLPNPGPTPRITPTPTPTPTPVSTPTPSGTPTPTSSPTPTPAGTPSGTPVPTSSPTPVPTSSPTPTATPTTTPPGDG